MMGIPGCANSQPIPAERDPFAMPGLGLADETLEPWLERLTKGRLQQADIGASVIKCCYAATGMYMTAAAALLCESANTCTSSLSHLTTRRRDTKMSRRVSRRPRGKSRLHRGRPGLASELQRPMRANEVVVAA